MSRAKQDIFGILLLEPGPVLVHLLGQCGEWCLNSGGKPLGLKALHYFLGPIPVMHIEIYKGYLPI
jgi:hypothetical protein